MLGYQQLFSSYSPSPLSLPHPLPPSIVPPSILSPSLTFLHKPTSLYCVSALPRPQPIQPWLTQLPKPMPTSIHPPEAGEGPIEIPPSEPSVFATTDAASPLQAASTVLLTGAISVFLFRALRRRAKRAKELVWIYYSLNHTHLCVFCVCKALVFIWRSWALVGF